MVTPVFVLNDWREFPGDIKELSLSKGNRCYLEQLAVKKAPILFALNTRFRAADAESLAPTAIIAEVENLKAKAEDTKISARLLRRVRLVNVQVNNGAFAADYEEFPETANDSAEELAGMRSLKGIFAEFLRQVNADRSSKLQILNTISHPSELVYRMIREFESAKIPSKRLYKQFSCYDKQRLIEAEPLKKLEFLSEELCKRIGCEFDSPAVAYNDADVYWTDSGVTSDRQLKFVLVGTIDSDGLLTIGCPSRFPPSINEEDRISVKAQKGKWSVYQTELSSALLSPASMETGEASDLNIFVISKNDPDSEWYAQVVDQGDSAVQVSSGVILAVPQALLADQDFTDAVSERTGQLVSSFEVKGKDYRYLSIETGGDGSFPVKLVTDKKKNLIMAIIYSDKI